MIRRALAVLLAFLPSPSIPQTLQPLEAIPLVSCAMTAGTAFRIGPHLLLSVGHVSSGLACQIDNEPINIVYASRKADFSILSDTRIGKWLKVDCRGFVRGRKYYAIGHARGLDKIVAVALVGTGAYDDGEAVLAGIFTAQPGQSGGPIIDAETNAVVGTVNAADWESGLTFSVELKRTPICGELA